MKLRNTGVEVGKSYRMHVWWTLCDKFEAWGVSLIVFLMTIARPQPPFIRMHKPGTLHVSKLLHNFNHTCMLRDLLTSTQTFFKFIITQLALLWYYHLHISKQLSSIKLILVFNALHMKVFILPNLDAHHIRNNFITKANYHAVLKDSQNNISESWEINNFYKIKPPPCSKKV